MFLLLAASVAFLNAHPAEPDQASKSNVAILKAIKQLREDAIGFEAAEKSKVDAAVIFLNRLLVATTDDALLIDFNDNPSKYKGRRLTFTLEVPVGLSGQEGLRDLFRPPAMTFVGRQITFSTKVVVDFSATKDLVNARGGEKVLVTFDCKMGDLGGGNVAISIRRPPLQ